MKNVDNKNRNEFVGILSDLKNPRRISFHSSYEEANESEAKQRALQSPQENFAVVNFLIRKIFSEELEIAMNKKLQFKNND